MKTFLFFFSLFITVAASAQTSAEFLEKAKDAAKDADFKKALFFVKGGLAKDPRNWELNEAAGVFWAALQNGDSAFVYMDRAILVNPSYYDLYVNRAKIFGMAKLYDRALADFETALSLNPPDTAKVDIVSMAALMKYEAGDYAGAVKDMDWVIDRASGPFLAGMYYGRGIMKFRHNDYPGAYADYTRSYALDSANINLLDDFSALCVKQDKLEEAIRLCRRLILFDPAHENAYPRLGFALQMAGRYKESNEALDMAIAQNPKAPYPYSNRAYNKMKLGDLEGAMKDVNLSLRLDRTNPYAYRNRGLIYLAMGDKIQACGEFRMALDLQFTQKYGNEVQELYKTTCP